MADRLAGVHPHLIVEVTKILQAMTILGFPMTVVAGVRTAEEQQKIYAQGRTKPGKIVTFADGIIKKSPHQVHDDGFGYAADLVFLVNGLPSWDDHLPWALYGAMAKALGLRWGGDFPTLLDRPHVEWAGPVPHPAVPVTPGP